MADVPIGAVHASTHVLAVTTPTSFPPTSKGKIELLALWKEEIPDNGIYFPFALQPDDYIIFVNQPLDFTNTSLRVDGLTLEFYGGHLQPARISAGVYLLHVVAASWPIQLFNYPYGRMNVFMAVYRGLNASDQVGRDERVFAWNNSKSLLSVRRAPLTYNAPAAKIATITSAKMPAELSTFNYEPDHGHWRDVISADDYNIEPNRQVTLEFSSIEDLSPLEDMRVYSTGGWDLDFETDGWGAADFYTFIFMTQQVDFLAEDVGNPAPAGNAHLPIRGL